MIHIAAVTRIRLDTEGRDYYRRKRAEGKSRWRQCGVSSAGSLTASTASCSTTRTPQPTEAPVRSLVRVREGTAGRLKNPARSTCPRTSTLRISHFPDPQQRRYARHRRLGRPTAGGTSKRPVDNRREPERRSLCRVPRDSSHSRTALPSMRVSPVGERERQRDRSGHWRRGGICEPAR